MLLEEIPVRILEYIKINTPLKRTWYTEAIFVLVVLVTTALISKKGAVEWIGVCAVFFTFQHASIAERLGEAEKKRLKDGENIYVDCYHKLPKYFYAKEACWLLYFVLVGAWSAVVGVFIFLLYPVWRKVWRKHHK